MKNKLKEEVLQKLDYKDSAGDIIDLTIAKIEKEIQKNYVHKSLIIKPDDWIRKAKVEKLIDECQRGEVDEGDFGISAKELKQKLGGEDEKTKEETR